MQAAAVAKHINEVIAAATAVVPLAERMEALPARVRQLQTELDQLTAQLTSTRNAFATLKSAWREEWARMKADRDLAQSGYDREQQSHSAMMDDLRSTLRTIQNEITKQMKKCEEIVRELRKAQRKYPDMKIMP